MDVNMMEGNLVPLKNQTVVPGEPTASAALLGDRSNPGGRGYGPFESP